MLLYLLEIVTYAFLVLLPFFLLLNLVFIFFLRGLFRVPRDLALATLRLLMDAFLPYKALYCLQGIVRHYKAIYRNIRLTSYSKPDPRRQLIQSWCVDL